MTAGFFSTKPRYCDYTGKYHCLQCHSDQRAIIPARILQVRDQVLLWEWIDKRDFFCCGCAATVLYMWICHKIKTEISSFFIMILRENISWIFVRISVPLKNNVKLIHGTIPRNITYRYREMTVLQNWDFRPFAICDASKAFLESTVDDPVYDIAAISQNLYHKVWYHTFLTRCLTEL